MIEAFTELTRQLRDVPGARAYSEHRYYLPQASSGWKYLWLLVFHPYVVQRIAQRVREAGPIMPRQANH